jgi:4-diphosphocytidyl-2-C-methyl-D-erythritol kinase
MFDATADMTISSLTIPAPAKLNLALSVGPRQAESGLHAVCSWMVTVSLADELTVLPLPSDRLSRYAIMWHEEARRRTDIDWPITRDLAGRAHLALERHVGRRLPLQLRLNKRIPVGAGLGGGSSNAAAMLRAVNELFALGLSLQELAAIGQQIGSDVPFLVHGGSAVVSGVGDRIDLQTRMPELQAVLVLPDVTCPTAEGYRIFDGLPGGGLREAEVAALAGRWSLGSGPQTLFNDLADAALEVAPALRALRDELSSLSDRPAHVTGSGSALFLLCDDALHAQTLAAAIEKRIQTPAVAVSAHEVSHAPVV